MFKTKQKTVGGVWIFSGTAFRVLLWELYHVTFHFLTVKTSLSVTNYPTRLPGYRCVYNNLQQSLPHPPPTKAGFLTLSASEDF